MELTEVSDGQPLESVAVASSRLLEQLGLRTIDDIRDAASHGEQCSWQSIDESVASSRSISSRGESRRDRVHTNEEIVRKLFKAFEANDMATIDALLADDVVWNAPGRGVNSGVRLGKQELFGWMGRLGELTGGTLRGEIHDVLASDDHAVVLQTTRGERAGRAPLEDREAIVLHVWEGRVVEVWEHPGDLHAMDSFFS